MSLKSKIEITSESDFREKVGLTEPVTLEWEEGKVVQATQDALDTLKMSMEGKAAVKKREMAEKFIHENEKKDAVDKLTERLGGNILKNPAVLAVAGTTAAGVGVAVHALDKQVEEVTGEKMGFMDSIRDWLKEAASEESGFMKKMWMLLYTMLGGKKEKEDGEKTESTDTSQYVSREGNENILQYKGYEMIAIHIFNKQHKRVFDGFWGAMGQGVKDSWNKDKVEAEKSLNKKAQDIMTSKFVKGATFVQLQGYQKNISSMPISEVNDPIGKEATKIALEVLCGKENEEFMDKELKTVLPNWRTRPMGESLVAIYHGWESEKIEYIRDQFQGLDMSKMSEVITKLPQMLLSKKQDGEYDGIIGRNIPSLRSQGLSNEIIERVMFIGNEKSQTIDDYGQYLKSHPFNDKKSEAFMEQLILPGGFPDKLQGTLDQFGLAQYKEDFVRKNMNIRQLLALYILTKGETDVSTMKKGTKTELFLALTSLIVEKHPISAPTDQFLKFIETPTNPHVKEILELLGTGVNRTAYEGMLLSIGLGQDAIAAANEIRERNPAIFYGAIGSIGLSVALAYYARVPFMVVIGAGAILKAAAFAAGVTYVGSSTK